MLILWKNVNLQGYGAGCTTLNAVNAPAEKLQLWREKLQGLLASAAAELLPGQELGFAGLEPDTPSRRRAAILVLGRSDAQTASSRARRHFYITGQNQGIILNG
jgi:hypothetical protein